MIGEGAAVGVGVNESVREGSDRLAAAGVVSAAADAAALWAAASGTKKPSCLTRDEVVSPEVAARYEAMLARRATREPLQLICGAAPFHDLELAVAPGVFIPRPETEGLAEHALRLIAGTPAPRVVELFAGVGPVAVLLAKRRPDAVVTAVERDPVAAALIRRNAATYGVAVNVVVGNVRDGAGGPFDLVVANPPYIPSSVWPDLPPEVRDWEPRAALDGGDDGLAWYRVLAALIATFITATGVFVFEVGETQAAAVTAMFANTAVLSVYPDLTGRDRYLIGRKS